MTALTSVAQGSLRPSITATWHDADGTALDLTAATLTGWIQDRTTLTTRAIEGTITPAVGTAGEFTWALAAADVADAGAFLVQFTATWAADPPIGRTALYTWTVEPSLVAPAQPVEFADWQGVIKTTVRTTAPDATEADKVGLYVMDDNLYLIDADGVIFAPVGTEAHAHTALDGAIRLGGDVSNHVAIGADGVLTLVGTARVWDDIRIEPSVRASGINVPAFEQYFTNGAGSRGVYLYSFDDAIANNEKEIYFTLQLPHGWAGTAIHLHCHFVPAATVNSSAVRWGLEYTWADPGAVFGNTAIVYASVAEGAPANMVANTHYVTEFAALTPSASQDNYSSVLIGRLFRNSSNAADTYTNKVGLLYIDANIEIDRLGIADEYA